MTNKNLTTHLTTIVVDFDYDLIKANLVVDNYNNEIGNSEINASVNNEILIKELIFSSLIEVFRKITVMNILKWYFLDDIQITGIIKLSTESESKQIIIPLFIIEDLPSKLGKLEGAESYDTFIAKDCWTKQIGIGFDDITLEHYLNESIKNINGSLFFEVIRKGLCFILPLF